MKKGGGNSWTQKPKLRKILHAFSAPKTPGQVEKELNIPKLKLQHLLEEGLLISLNSEAKKGRLYTLTEKARKMLGLPKQEAQNSQDWDLIGWILASPKQRLPLLQTLTTGSRKRTSEEIREKASKLNPRLSRISTKDILNELTRKKLVGSELKERRRYYWILKKGKSIIQDLGER